MATSALQQIIAHEPGLATRIDAMTELIPGVPASKENLKTLLEHVTKEEIFRLTGTDETSLVMLRVASPSKKKKELRVSVWGEAEVLRRAHEVYNERPCVCSEAFNCTEDGLLEGLLYAKQSKKRYREEGACADCVRSVETQSSRKKLKAKGMPKCEACMLKAVVA